jgi:2-polyprenyl-3-methyl-5-hydroxy-6-metoxy-1,4-benzoquinol methylase
LEVEAWEAGADAWVARVRETARKAHDASIRSLLPPPAGLTLDVGCGEGRLTRALAESGYDVVGVDRSAALVEAARAKHADGRYEVAPIDALPFADGAAMLVLCANVLPHVEDLTAATHELARVASPNGILVVGHRHPVREAGSIDEATGELRVRRYFDHEPHAVPLGDGHVFHQHRTIEDYLSAFRVAGFVLEDLREVPDATGSVPSWLDLRFAKYPPL